MAPTLRASCDSCKQAKVKCTKTKPQCARCTKQQTCCVYGISLRTGKRIYQYQQHQQHQHQAQQHLGQPEPDVIDARQFPDNWSWDYPTPSAPYVTTEVETPLLFKSDVPCQLNEYAFTQDQYHPFPIPDLAYADAKLVDYSQIPNHSPALSSSTLSYSAESSATASSCHSNRSQSLSSQPFQPCNCFQTMILTLSKMQQFSESAHLGAEVALNYNAEALHLCMSTLQCVCARESSTVLLVGSLIAKIISLYDMHCVAFNNVDHSALYQESMCNFETHLRLDSYGVVASLEERLKTEAEKLLSHLRGIDAQTFPNHEMMVCKLMAVSLFERFKHQHGDGASAGRLP